MGLLLQKAGCPIHPQDIGLDVGRQYATLRKAQLIRNRYTILDALDDLGLMDKVVADMGSR
jgi:glycerol-1-phosphate dehydrogenase [NAD(P)+]